MIVNFNKYVNKDIIKEKVEIDVNTLIDNVKNKTESSKKNVVYNNITSDGYPITINGVYYALFYTDKEDGEKFYTVGKIKILKEYFKRMKSGKTISMYAYRLTSVNPILQDLTEPDPNMSDREAKSAKLNKYSVYSTEKVSDKKANSKRINGYYLYKEDKTDKDLNDILSRYNINDKKGEDDVQSVQKSDVKIDAGNVYELVNSKGKTITLCITKKTNDEIFGVDIINNKQYPNIKIDNIKSAKHINNIYDHIRKDVSSVLMKNWKSLPDFTDIDNDKDRLAYVKKKYNTAVKYFKLLKTIINNRSVPKSELLNSIRSINSGLTTSVRSMESYIKNLNSDKNTIKNKGVSGKSEDQETLKQVEPKDTNVDDNDTNGKKVVSDIEKSEEKAQSVQVQKETV